MARLSILLLLISLVYATPYPQTQISKKIGDDATISCSRNNTTDYVVMSAWYKEPNSIILLAAKSDVLYFDNYTKDKISYDSPYDDLVTTITIKSLTAGDAGTYVCAFFMTSTTNDTDKVDYEDYSTELIVNTDSESTIDIILSGSTHSPETSSEKPDYIDNSNCSSVFEIATPEPITDKEDHTVTDTVVYTTVSTSSGVVTTKSTTDDADLYDTYNDNESSTVLPTTVESITKSIGKYSTKDFAEIFGITALIILSAVAVFCITYYICNKRSRKYKTENKV
ncbi:hemoagglutinine [Ectromelia virus]|uniref:Hemagglutinin n=3 Tax=Ectromelia virus TaxID=12643 RepID=A0AAX7FDV0_9POXV|nr:EVM151 [Ectromelia virus]AFH54721.1 hemagglutinin [Ectromelia virus ERPV]QSV39745.1 hemagglutinin [Ectromelia virus WH]AAM92456.1 EVM151 [Ectromelia virus]AAN47025.1 hemagglutinin [Ectromelia virus]AAN47026.1 hemagglutinin [Ectromelia virus]